MYFNFNAKKINNKFYDGEPKKDKNYYGIIKCIVKDSVGFDIEKRIVVDCTTKFKTKAEQFFYEIAKENNGHVEYIGVYR